jgi:hypothetical protein
MIERRIDHVTRKRVSEMSPEEMRRALLISQKTGLPNRRAFDEGRPSAFVAMSDVNGLKAMNDKYGYNTGETPATIAVSRLRLSMSFFLSRPSFRAFLGAPSRLTLKHLRTSGQGVSTPLNQVIK